MTEPVAALAQLRIRRESLDRIRAAYDADEIAAVRAARLDGMPWDRIASVLGRTRSAVWERYHRQVDA